MKCAAKVVIWLSLLAGAILLGRVMLNGPKVPTPTGPPEPDVLEARVPRPPSEPVPEVNTQTPPDRFAAFPVGQKKLIDFAADRAIERGKPVQEIEEQLRDWLLYAVVAGAGLSEQEVRDSLAGVPAVRNEALGVNPPRGVLRSCRLIHDELLALLPSGEKAQHKALLCVLVDEQRRAVGRRAKLVRIFQYELVPERNLAWVAAAQPLQESDLFGPAYGYHEAEVGDLESLKRFAERVDYVVHAQKSSDGWLLGGRKSAGGPRQGVDLDAVVAVLTAELQTRKEWSENESLWSSREQSIRDDLAGRTKTYEAKWSKVVTDVGTGSEKSSIRDLKLNAADEAKLLRADAEKQWREFERQRTESFDKIRTAAEERSKRVSPAAVSSWRSLTRN